MFRIKRRIPFCAGHRVYLHESKCNNLHGHNYVAIFEVAPRDELDSLGRVIDFSVIKDELKVWIDENWDHKFILNEIDPAFTALEKINGKENIYLLKENPTAEVMAKHLFNVGTELLEPYKVKVVSVYLEETENCSATFTQN